MPSPARMASSSVALWISAWQAWANTPGATGRLSKPQNSSRMTRRIERISAANWPWDTRALGD
ncbi:hypothetical protein OR16_22538 [Cupriavidus basilensis OR16]|uniref:Uncharacterized protein n=1 Tax=Cupriavidus basilensis OR16 TaxID=1127483 RepID=H1S926_9BURK|nr:hypothetical protein OR16_22538 [Cupriavidus basilensis OR16]